MAQRREPRNVVVCLDGTNNRVRGTARTNVLRLYHLLDLDDSRRQVAYYGPGVGTAGAVGAWSPPGQALTRGLGLAFGAGIRPGLGDAYRFVMSVYEPGDRIFVVGFSRGAYTARALCGMLEVFGVFRPGAKAVVPYAVREYTAMTHSAGADGGGPRSAAAREKEREQWRALEAYEDFARRRWVRGGDGAWSLETRHVPVRFVGLWDTVNAVGTRLRTIGWPYTAALPHAQTVRSAVALDEWRWRYRPVFVGAARPDHPFRADTDVEQVWFAGVHTDVGGRYGDRTRLSDVPLAWMVREAAAAGVLLSTGRLRAAFGLTPGVRTTPDGDRRISPSAPEAMGPARRHSPLWLLAGRSSRRPAAGALVHASVRQRLADPRYAALVEGCRFVDEDWADLSWIPRPQRRPTAAEGPAAPRSAQG